MLLLLLLLVVNSTKTTPIGLTWLNNAGVVWCLLDHFSEMVSLVGMADAERTKRSS